MTAVIEVRRLERQRQAVVKSRAAADRHEYFQGVAQARYVIRKCFRLVEAQAKLAGVDPLAHQALIQIYGSPHSTLRVKEIAERLDISPAFASNLVKQLMKSGNVASRRDENDMRVARIAITKTGKALLHQIDEKVHIHVDYFTRQLSREQREAALSVFLFYVGISIAASKLIEP